MIEEKLGNIYVIHHIPYVRVESEIFTHIYTKKGIVPNYPNMLTSDEGDNIAHLNPLYAEYTTFYWVWKNQKPAKYTGFFHYRRYISINDNVENQFDIKSAIDHYGWDEKTLKSVLDNYDVILPNPVIFPGSNVKSHYYNNNPGAVFLDVALDIIANKYPDFIQDCNEALYKDRGHFCNMFIIRTDLFDKYMTWVMDIFNEIQVRLEPSNTVKVCAYLGERLFIIYIQHLIRVYNVRVKVNPWMYVVPNSDNVTHFSLIDSNFHAQ